ncbi:MAG: hypothetical protein RIC80_22500 [Cyclobacteriaceae bacterium]
MVTFNFDFSESQLNEGDQFLINGIDFELRLSTGSFSTETALINQKVNSGTKLYQDVKFKISSGFKTFIDQNKPFKAPVHLKFNVKMYVMTLRTSSGSMGNEMKLVDIFNTNLNQDISIPYSTWNDQIVGPLYGKYDTVYVPHFDDKSPYEHASNEMKQAESYLHAGDYDKVVAHCRSALESLKRNISILKDTIESKSENEWFDKNINLTNNWLKEIVATNQKVSNKAHHPPSFGHFNKSSAESIYMICIALLYYTGENIKP